MKLTINLPNYQKENPDTVKKRRDIYIYIYIYIARDKKNKRSKEDTKKNEELKANISVISNNG